MNVVPATATNVKQVVPFLRVSSMETSLVFYVEGLAFAITKKWVVDGKLRWCWLTLGGASIMLQEFSKEGHDSWQATGQVGEGVSICFQCEDALAIYREVSARGMKASEPEVGNGMWVTSLSDPDGYRLEFESDTDVEEDTKLSELTV